MAQISLPNIPCEEEAVKILENWQSKNQWQRKFVDIGSYAYISPTLEIGVWVSVEEVNSQNLELIRSTSSSITKISFNSVC